jgi:pimeloyl-ACP methyl ester carboxylesterase
MATFVLVHGAWGGGWEWRTVARLLTAHGHEAFTPTLTGLGERRHLGGPHVDLDTHIEDVAAVLETEDLGAVVLCGQSYGGMVIGSVADRLAERIAQLVYVDAFVPRDGESALDLVPPAVAQRLRDLAVEAGEGWQVPLPFDAGEVAATFPGELGRRYVRQLRAQPLGTFSGRARLTGAADGLPHTYIRCAGHAAFEEAVLARSFDRALALGWAIRQLEAPHDAQVFAPQQLTALLEETAARGGREGTASAGPTAV